MKNTVLLIPDKTDIERDAVAEAWIEAGGEVIRVAEFWNPPAIEDKEIKVYGNSMFCLVLEQKLDIKLISPSDYILNQLEIKWLKRNVEFLTLSDSNQLDYPLFVKPVIPKLFIAGVFQNEKELLDNCVGLSDETEIITSDIVTIESEVRCFILNGELKSLAIYEGDADLESANQFVTDFLAHNSDLLPSTVVLDLGYIPDEGWVIVEANPSWGAGLNGCNASEVLGCIYNATEKVAKG